MTFCIVLFCKLMPLQSAMLTGIGWLAMAAELR